MNRDYNPINRNNTNIIDNCNIIKGDHNTVIGNNNIKDGRNINNFIELPNFDNLILDAYGLPFIPLKT